MYTQNINSANFQGNIYKVGRFSNKPKECLSIVENKISELIQPRSYNLYIQQDYRSGRINITAGNNYIVSDINKNQICASIPCTAESSKYIEASEKAIDKYEEKLKEKAQSEWEQKQKLQKKQNILDTVEFILCCPIYIVGNILEGISPKFGKKFDKVLQKIGL